MGITYSGYVFITIDSILLSKYYFVYQYVNQKFVRSFSSIHYNIASKFSSESVHHNLVEHADVTDGMRKKVTCNQFRFFVGFRRTLTLAML